MDEFSCSTKILDAEYKPAIIDKVTKTCDNFNLVEQHQLLQLFQKYEHLFDGTLGGFNMVPISINLIDPGSKPVHAPLTREDQVENSLMIGRYQYISDVI
jgi:hypothetical protein